MEFTVINADVIRRNCIAFTDSDQKDLDDLEDLIVKFKDISCLDLSSLNILHITNLSLLSPVNLTSLKLSVNRIDKICNLDSFTNLVELDLSHNHIKKIENLQGLVKLKRLVLNHNPVTTVENLDTQRDSLEMLDVGCCEIVDLKFTLYLKRFTNLVSLIVAGNPFRTEPVDMERKFVVSMVRSLLVYNNKTVTVEERKKALETFSKLVTMIEKNDKKWKTAMEEEKLRSTRIKGRRDAFLDRMPPEGEGVDFNASVFRNPTVEQVLQENSRYGIQNVYRRYAEDFRRLIDEITATAETNRDARVRLIDEFREELRRLIDDAVDESRRCVSGFSEYKKRLERDSQEDSKEGSPENDRKKLAREMFATRIHDSWLTLMRHEDKLSRKITEMIDELRDALEKQISELKQLVDSRFCTLQRQQNVFLQFVLEYAVSSSQSDDTNNGFCRVSQFTNDISQCMESQALLIERAELNITQSASKWLDDVFNDLNGEEVQRNRRKISEIATFVRFQKESFDRTTISKD